MFKQVVALVLLVSSISAQAMQQDISCRALDKNKKVVLKLDRVKYTQNQDGGTYDDLTIRGRKSTVVFQDSDIQEVELDYIKGVRVILAENSRYKARVTISTERGLAQVTLFDSKGRYLLKQVKTTCSKL